jgi:cytidylate kinase
VAGAEASSRRQEAELRYNVREEDVMPDRRTLVALSRQVGAGGAYVGQALSRLLGIRYVDREILQEAARILGRDDRELESLEERVTSLWDRMAAVLAWGAPEAAYVPPPLPTLCEEDLFAVESGIIREIAAREDAVFVGRAATWVLRDTPGLLSVFLHAPEDVRLERVMRDYNLADRAAAHDVLRRSDQQRSRFVQSVTGGSWFSLSHYHLAIDTGAVSLDDAVAVIARLVQLRQG